MLRELWYRMVGRRDKRADEEAGMSPSERHFIDKSQEDRQADLAAGEHLLGGDPGPRDPDR